MSIVPQNCEDGGHPLLSLVFLQLAAPLMKTDPYLNKGKGPSSWAKLEVRGVHPPRTCSVSGKKHLPSPLGAGGNMDVGSSPLMSSTTAARSTHQDWSWTNTTQPQKRMSSNINHHQSLSLIHHESRLWTLAKREYYRMDQISHWSTIA